MKYQGRKCNVCNEPIPENDELVVHVKAHNVLLRFVPFNVTGVLLRDFDVCSECLRALVEANQFAKLSEFFTPAVYQHVTRALALPKLVLGYIEGNASRYLPREEIINAIYSDPAERTRSKYAQISNTLKRLADKGKIRKVKRGVWTALPKVVKEEPKIVKAETYPIISSILSIIIAAGPNGVPRNDIVKQFPAIKSVAISKALYKLKAAGRATKNAQKLWVANQ